MVTTYRSEAAALPGRTRSAASTASGRRPQSGYRVEWVHTPVIYCASGDCGMAWLADTQAIAVIVRRPPATIRSWAYRGKLPRRGTDGRGRALYDVEEAQKLAARLASGMEADDEPSARTDA